MESKMRIIVILVLLFSIHVNADNVSDSDTLFDFAEASFPELFSPAGQETFKIDGYLARYYPNTNNYVGTLGDDVYVLGDVFGGLVKVGVISDFIDVTPNYHIFRDTLQDGTQGPQMVVVPAGTFRMGDIQGVGSIAESPVHQVTISNNFAMGVYEVTFAEYDKFAEATGRRIPEDYYGDFFGLAREDRPVVAVSWDDATAYAAWLSKQTGEKYRLPTEAEWEYATRAGTETEYWWGDEIACSNADYYDDCAQYHTRPVGSFEANPFGLYDVHGNVSEWVQDWFDIDYYDSSESVDPTGPANGSIRVSARVLRGGYYQSWPDNLRSANRNAMYPHMSTYDVGFRLARDY